MSDKIIYINGFDLSGYEVMRSDQSYVIDARELKGLTQQQMSDALEMSLEMYQLFEAGRINVNDQVLLRIRTVLDNLSASE